MCGPGRTYTCSKANTLPAGADLKEIATLDAEEAKFVRYLEDLCLGMMAFGKPIIAAVNGPAVSPDPVYSSFPR